MAKKEFTYRGKTLAELKNMPKSEFLKLLPARQRRSLTRDKTEQHKIFLTRFQKKPDGLKTHCRDIIVMPEMVGHTIQIHSGKEFVKIIIEPEMIGTFFGELVLTRKRVAHNSPGVGATKSSSSVSVR